MLKIINNLTNKNSKTTKINELNVKRVTITNADSTADALNTYFNDVGSDLADKLPESHIAPETYITLCNTSFELRKITPNEVHRLLSRTKPSKVTGHDRITPKLVRDCADIVAESLTIIFNMSIETGIFPDDFKLPMGTDLFVPHLL